MNHTVPPVRLLLVDDSGLVRRGIKTVLAAEDPEGRFEIVGEAATAAEAVESARRLAPDIILLDIRLPDGSGLEVCRTVLGERPATHIIILTSFSNDNYVYEAVIAGARGYLMKEIDPAGLVQALRDVADGRSILDPDATTRVLRLLRQGGMNEPAADFSTLSAQERRVLALVADGLTNKQVGDQLNLSENTVKNYLMNVFEKLQVKRRAQAAALWVQQNQQSRD